MATVDHNFTPDIVCESCLLNFAYLSGMQVIEPDALISMADEAVCMGVHVDAKVLYVILMETSKKLLEGMIAHVENTEPLSPSEKVLVKKVVDRVSIEKCQTGFQDAHTQGHSS